MYSCCGVAKFCFVFTSGTSVELVSFTQCFLLGTQKQIALLPGECVPLRSCDYREIEGNG